LVYGLIILFAGDTSVVIASRNFEDFCSPSNLVLSDMIKRFAADNLVLSLDKTNTKEIHNKGFKISWFTD